MMDPAEMHERLKALLKRINDFPEARICEHGATLNSDAHVALLDLRKLLANEILPELARRI